ncbi:MAG: Ig-like domain-containing protein [Gemmatimonadetes bacterium]|nr:Ig-like domain-containing protein [Candidatus Palauibacter australiensis]
MVRQGLRRRRALGGRGRLRAGFTLPAAAVAGIAALVLSCGDDGVGPTPPPPPPPPPPPAPVATTVTVNPRSVSFTALGETARFTAEVRDQNGQVMAGAAVAWTSSDASVATVDASGEVTAAGNGTATITATAGSASGSAAVTVASDAGDDDRAALEVLYRRTGGPRWIRGANWLTDAPLDTWHGVVVVQGRVTELTLRDNGLEGSVPPQLGNLSRLEHLDLSENDLSGPVPPELGRLSRLERLDFYDTNVTGRIPPELGNLANLAILSLDENNLTGSVPRSFLKLDALRTFRIEGNDGLCVPGARDFVTWWRSIDRTGGPLCSAADAAALEALHEAAGGAGWTNSGGWLEGETVGEWYGVTADSIGRVAALDLRRNGLTGRLPGQLGDLTAMTRLRLDGNALSGSLPLSLTAVPLEEFRYADTELCVPADAAFREWLSGIATHDTGTECGPLSERDILARLYDAAGGRSWRNDDNWLTRAPLSDWYGVETVDGQVSALRLSENGLAGIIPAELGSLAGLQVLELADNDLAGRLPATLGRLRGLRSLALRGNRLTGRVPVELGSLFGLERLDLAVNALTGPIPAELGNLSNLRDLDLTSNSLSGPIPDALGGLSSLQTLYLGDNRLSGRIPDALGRLSRLESLYLARSRLSGPIPAELGNLSRLLYLYLDGNALSGPIPAELGNLSSLNQLHLQANALSGEIPAELGNLPRLSDLYLHDNALSGPIPAELGNLRNLNRLYLRANNLAGSLPPELGNLSRLAELSVALNDLTGSIPAEFSGMVELERLNVAHNPGLSGPLPVDLTALRSLQDFQAAGTDLCAPAGADFQSWLNEIGNRWVATCAEVEGSVAYLTQAVQSLGFPVPLVAGEAALLRVFVTAPAAAGERIPPVRARFFQDGSETYVADIPQQSAAIPRNIDEGSLLASANVEIPASVVVPGLEMVVEIDPDGTLDPGLGVQRRIPETGRTAVDVRTPPVLDLTVIPFLWSVAPDRSIVDLTANLSADHDIFLNTRTLLPVGDLQVSVHEPVTTDRNRAFDLVDVTEMIRVLEGATGHYMGMMTGELGSSFIGAALEPGRSSFAIWRTDVVAHELGHNMSLAHAPCGGAGRPDPAFPQRDGSIGDWGYDFVTGRLVPPTAPDFMSYCGPPDWTGSFHFTKALRFRSFDDSGAAAAVAGPARSLLLWGGVDSAGTPFLEPAFVVDAPPVAPRAAGDHQLTGWAADGRELFSLSFAMPEVADGEGAGSFVFALPVRAGWAAALASIALSGPGGSATLDGATDRPMAILRDPRTGQVRAFLSDLPAAARTADAVAQTIGQGLEVLFSRGIPPADAWRP